MTELEEYEEQLKEVKDSLKLDPENESLKELETELLNIIELLVNDEPTEKEDKHHTLEQITSTSSPTSVQLSPDLTKSTPPLETFNVGDIVFVKPKLEKIHKEAKITNRAGNGKSYTVQFLDSQIIETFAIDHLFKELPKKDLVSKYKQQQLLKEQKKQEKRVEKEQYEQELNKSVNTWKTFNTKKKVKKTMGNSQFKTSSNFKSKIGVIGSGESMTSAKKKEKNLRYNPY